MKIALIGAGGLAKEFLDVAQMLGHEVVGTFSTSGSLNGIAHLGYLDDLLAKREAFDGVAIAIGIHNIDRIKSRREIIDFLNEHHIKHVSLVSPHSRIHSSVFLGDGVYIHHDVIISCDTYIGNNTIINTSARIGHDCKIGENVSVGPCVFIGGNTEIGNDVLIGVSSSIRDGLKIGNNCIIGMGSLVLKSMNENQLIMPSAIRAIDR